MILAELIWRRGVMSNVCDMETLENKMEQSLLKFESVAPEVYELLHKLKRTGWVNKGVENPESVKEHTEALLLLAQELSEFLSDEEKDGLFEMLEVHDWPEALHGDEVILEIRPDERKILKNIKFEKERLALEKICENLPNGDMIMDLWLRFETSNDPASVFGRQLDKYQAVEKALEYEEQQNIALFEEFLVYSINFINHPVLLDRIEKLKVKWGKNI